MDDFELASALFGARRAEDGSADATRTVYARAVGDSSDGMVEVAIGDDVVADGEEWDDDGNQVDPGAGATVAIPTEVAVREGDDVTVTLVGGTAKSPMGSGVRGGGDRMQAEIDAASSAATEAQAMAAATGQHFWDDAAGAHVTEAARAEWESEPSGHNVLINSLGILLCKALAPLVGVTQSAVAFFDGLGDAAENVVARFGRDGATIGKVGGVHVGIDSNSLDVSDGHGTTFLHAGLANDDETGLYSRTSYGYPGESEWHLPLRDGIIARVALRDDETGAEEEMAGGAWTYDSYMLRLAGGASVPEGKTLVVTYGTYHPVPMFTAGQRLGSYDDGEYSAVFGQARAVGYCSMATGMDCHPNPGLPDNHTIASGMASQAMGSGCHATGDYSCAVGDISYATGTASFASGRSCRASGLGSAAIGIGARATQAGMIALGKYNYPKAGDVLEVGDGTSDSGRRNALRLTRDGYLSVEGTNPGFCTLDTDDDYSIGSPKPSSDRWSTPIGVRGSDGNWTMLDNLVHRTTGEVQRIFTLRRRNAADTGNVEHLIRMGVSESGSPTLSFGTRETAMAWRRAMYPMDNAETMFSGVNVGKGGTLGTNAKVFNYRWFQVALSSGGYLIAYRTGSQSANGNIHGIGGTDDGSSTYTYHCRLSVSTAGLVKVVGASRHKLTSSGAPGETLNVTALYGIN